MKKLFGIFQSIFIMIAFVLVAFNGLGVAASTTNDPDGYYTIAYENNELKILLNADLSVYKNLKKDDLTKLKEDLTSAIYNAIIDDLDFDLSKTGSTSSSSTAGSSVDMSLLGNILTSQLTSVEEIGKYLNEKKLDKFIEYYIDRYYDEFMQANPQAKKDEVFEEITNQLNTKVAKIILDVYTAEGQGKWIADPQEKSGKKIKEIVAIVKANKENSQSVEIEIGDVKDIINTIEKDEIVDAIKEIGAEDEIVDIIAKADTKEVVDLLTGVEVDTIIEVCDNLSSDNKDQIKDAIKNVSSSDIITIIDSFKTDDSEAFDKLKDLVSAVGFDEEELKEVISKSTSEISISTLLSTLKKISINGNEVYDGTNGYKLDINGIKEVIKDLPKLGEIANFTDDEMHLNWNIVAETILGKVEFDLTIGLYGDASYVRKIAKELADIIDVKVENGVYNITITAPEKFTTVLVKLANTSAVSDEVKQTLFKDLFSKVNELYEVVSSREVSEYIELLKGVDYKVVLANLYNAEKLNSALGTTKFTDDGLDSFVDSVCSLVKKTSNLTYNDVKDLLSKYADISFLDGTAFESLINAVLEVLKGMDALEIDSSLLREFISSPTSTNESVYKYIDNLANYEGYYDKALSYLEAVYNKLPERVKDNSIIDFYHGNGVINYSGNLPLNFDSILNKISSQYGETLKSVFENLPESIDVSLTLKLHNVYKVTFNNNGKVTTGLLPAGAELKVFGIDDVKWVDSEGTVYTEMPEKDIELFAKTNANFEAKIASGVSKTYDGVSSTLTCKVTPSGSYSYQWYKNGYVISGATSSTYSVCNVSDSGSYYCKVSSGTEATYSNTVYVSISKARIQVSDYDWNYSTALKYTGEEQTVKLKNVPSYISVTYSNNTATEVGTYTAKAYLEYSSSNYELSSDVVSLIWKIEKNTIDLSTIKWAYTNAYTYDGNEKQVVLNRVPSNVTVKYEGNKATNAGSYTAKVSFEYDEAHYELVGKVNDLNWEIKKAKYVVENIWDYSEPFVYDGTSHSVYLQAITPGSGISFRYEGASAVNAGKYTAKVYFEYEDENYKLEETVYSLTWEIKKASIDTSSVKWDYSEAFTYDGNEKSVKLVESSIPSGVKVSYSGNKGTNVGKYTAKALFELIDKDNYELLGNTSSLSWEIKSSDKKYQFELKDGNVIVISISSKDGLDSNYNISLEEVNDLEINLSFDGKVVKTYEIKFVDENGEEIKVDGKFTVKLLIPEEYRSSENLKVVYVDSEGNVTEMTSKVSGDYIEFETTHFSIYSIVEAKKAASHAWVVWLIVGLVVLALIPVGYIIIKKYKK